MKKLRVLVATAGAALAIGLFAAPAEAKHICITGDEPKSGIAGEIQEFECQHSGLDVFEIVCLVVPVCF